MLLVVGSAALRSLPSRLLHRTAHNMTTCFIRRKSQRRSKRENKMEVTDFFNLIPEVVSPHFYCSLYKYLKQVIKSGLYTKGRNFRRVECQKSGIIGGIILDFAQQRRSHRWWVFINIVVRCIDSRAMLPTLKSCLIYLITSHSEQVI